MPILLLSRLQLYWGKMGLGKQKILITCKLIKLENSRFQKYTYKTILLLLLFSISMAEYP